MSDSVIRGRRVTAELASVFDYIKQNIIKEYPSDRIIPEHFLLSVLDNENCMAYKTINKIMFNETIEMLKSWYRQYLSNKCVDNPTMLNDEAKYDNMLIDALKPLNNDSKDDIVSSADVLCNIIEMDDAVRKSFRLIGVTEEQIKENLVSEKDSRNNDINASNKATDDKISRSIAVVKSKPKIISNEVERNLLNLNNLAAEGKIDDVYENDDIILDIFANLQKRYQNNVILVGESGCGKTATVRHIANMLVNNAVPKPFQNKKLVLMDFMSLISGTGYRGSFEIKIGTIVNDAKKDGNYIFFVDDIQSILGDKSKFGEVDIETILNSMLSEKRIQFICTTNHKSYKKYIENNALLKRRFQKIEMETPSIDKSIKILKHAKTKLETYHDIHCDDDTIGLCVKLCKRYISESVLPDSAINVIDKIGAKIAISEKESDAIRDIKRQMKENEDEKERVNNLPYKDYDKIDELTRREIRLKTCLSVTEKDEKFHKKAYRVTEDDIRNVISEMTNMPPKNLTMDKDEFDRLRRINENIKLSVVGQDEAVDSVCNAIKKHKLGISNPDKPSVFLFVGSTGTGKTLLAKKIAKEVYGDEKYLVRLDMSEYSDKTSVTKLYGASSGYVGYDNGGILTEAVKKNKYCVLLLDEIEKADDEVHNAFLQLFDEGRMTDNTGCTVDFKDTTIIMTSNVGARELDEKGNGIGFNKNSVSFGNDIIDKSIKKKFKPEFINRINKIVYFNRLNEENIRAIIHLELKELERRLNNADYYLEENFIDATLVDSIFSKIDSNRYGARMIIRQIENDVEDRIMDYILTHNIDKRHTFTRTELSL